MITEDRDGYASTNFDILVEVVYIYVTLSGMYRNILCVCN